LEWERQAVQGLLTRVCGLELPVCFSHASAFNTRSSVLQPEALWRDLHGGSRQHLWWGCGRV